MKLDNCYVNLKQEMLFVKKKRKSKKKKKKPTGVSKDHVTKHWVKITTVYATFMTNPCYFSFYSLKRS